MIIAEERWINETSAKRKDGRKIYSTKTGGFVFSFESRRELVGEKKRFVNSFVLGASIVGIFSPSRGPPVLKN